MDRFFRLHGVSLRLSVDRSELLEQIERFLVYFGLTPAPPGPTTLCLELTTGEATPARDGWRQLDQAGIEVAGDGERVELRCDHAWLVVDGWELQVTGRVAPPVGRDRALNMNLVSYALLTLLRQRGLYPLHAAGLARRGRGVLVVADSGGGKTTLAGALLRRGWGFLSDDSLLLRDGEAAVEALALRRELFVVAAPGASPRADKLRLDPAREYPERVLERCTPRLLVFPEIQDRDRSAVAPCPPEEALHLLAHHGLVAEMERGRAAAHMAVLARLVGQCRSCRLAAGRDLLADDGCAATLLEPLLPAARDEERTDP